MTSGIEIKGDVVVLDKAVWGRIVRLIGNEWGDTESGVIDRVKNGGDMDLQAQEEARVDAQEDATRNAGVTCSGGGGGGTARASYTVVVGAGGVVTPIRKTSE